MLGEDGDGDGLKDINSVGELLVVVAGLFTDAATALLVGVGRLLGRLLGCLLGRLEGFLVLGNPSPPSLRGDSDG